MRLSLIVGRLGLLALVAIPVYVAYIFFSSLLDAPVEVYVFASIATALLFAFIAIKDHGKSTESKTYKSTRDFLGGFLVTMVFFVIISFLVYDFSSGSSAPICNPDIQECPDWDYGTP